MKSHNVVRFRAGFIALLAMPVLACLTLAAVPFDPVDPLAIERAVRAANDTAGVSDMMLFRIEPMEGQEPFSRNEVRYVWYSHYSPSTQIVSRVLIAKPDTISAVIEMMFQAPRPSIMPVPTRLELSGGDLSMNRFFAALRADPVFTASRAQHPGAPVVIAIRMAADPTDYPAPEALSDAGPLWVAYDVPIGDSAFVSMYSPRSGEFVCSTYRALDDFSMSRAVVDGDLALGVASDGRWVHDGGFTYPRAGGVNYFAGAGVWFGARKRVKGTLVPRVFISYDPQAGTSWGTSGEALIPRADLPRAITHTSAAHNTLTGAPIDAEPYPWPLWLASPHTSGSYMHPGEYVPRVADRIAGGAYARPAFASGAGEHLISRFHDSRLERHLVRLEADGFPIGLQMQQDVFTAPGGMASTVFVRYAIVNISSDTLFDAVVAPMADWDIGEAGNDGGAFYSARPELRSLKGWSSYESRTPKAVLMTLLEAPVTDGSGRIDNGRRAEYRTDGRLGTVTIWTLGREDPLSSAARYDSLTQGSFDSTTTIGDQRGVLASQTFTMYPGDTAYVALGVTLYTTESQIDSLAERMIDLYYIVPPAGAKSESSAQAAHTITPNPAADRATLRLPTPAGADASLRIVDVLGRTVLTAPIAARATTVEIDLRDLMTGRYVVAVGGAAVQMVVVR